jgi:TRAP-type C4-dicarboxylate transport system substrate-binding protein
MDHQGIMAVDIASYGNYGWATTVPVKTIADAKQVKFRIAEAAVNKLSYKSWGFNPVVMPWPDVPVALKQGVITGLDHTLTVCSITKKFEVAKYFTELNYAQGLFIWLFNKSWYNSLPKDLQKTLVETVRDMCAEARIAAKAQEMEQRKAAMGKGIEFFQLSGKEMGILKDEADAVHQKFAPEINKLQSGDKYRQKNYLLEVQKYMGYTK